MVNKCRHGLHLQNVVCNNLVTILEGAMEECRHISNGKCTHPDYGAICYCGCPLHKNGGVRDNGTQQPHAVKVEDSHIPEAGTSA